MILIDQDCQYTSHDGGIFFKLSGVLDRLLLGSKLLELRVVSKREMSAYDFSL